MACPSFHSLAGWRSCANNSSTYPCPPPPRPLPLVRLRLDHDVGTCHQKIVVMGGGCFLSASASTTRRFFGGWGGAAASNGGWFHLSPRTDDIECSETWDSTRGVAVKVRHCMAAGVLCSDGFYPSLMRCCCRWRWRWRWLSVQGVPYRLCVFGGVVAEAVYREASCVAPSVG